MRLARPLIAAALAAHAALVCAIVLGDAGGALTAAVRDWFQPAVFAGVAVVCLAAGARRGRADRAAWLAMGAGVSLYASGSFYFNLSSAVADDPFPTAADALWLAFYPLAALALVLLARSRHPEHDMRLWLDGLMGALAVATLGATFLYQPVFDHGLGIGAALAYPVGDLLLTGFVVGMAAVGSWRFDRVWILLASGFTLVALGDSAYVIQAAHGEWTPGTLLDVPYSLGLIAIGAAAWSTRGRAVRPREARLIGFPIAFAGSAVALEVYGELVEVSALAHALNSATLAVAVVRSGIAIRDYARLLAESRRDALTDAVTGLGNRRRLLRDLEEVVEAARDGRPAMLALFDLDGFKDYNDSFGHGAGDALLARVGARLAGAVAPTGRAYRIGGDEFCVVCRGERSSWQGTMIAAEAALREEGEGFCVAASGGWVAIPDEAEAALEALRLADQRMYGEKNGRRSSASTQTHDLLVRVLSERQPELREQRDDVARLAVSVGRRLGLDAEELFQVGQAAELHDVGKIALPDAILRKRGPLSEEEWAYMRRHSLIGERFLGAVPSLRRVAEIVRASHERWDGSGYPDGLRGEQIPLGARIVAVCNAYQAMTAARPYRTSLAPAEALGELERCSGTQFDPAVVAAFGEELGAEAACPAVAPLRAARPA